MEAAGRNWHQPHLLRATLVHKKAGRTAASWIQSARQHRSRTRPNICRQRRSRRPSSTDRSGCKLALHHVACRAANEMQEAMRKETQAGGDLRVQGLAALFFSEAIIEDLKFKKESVARPGSQVSLLSRRRRRRSRLLLRSLPRRARSWPRRSGRTEAAGALAAVRGVCSASSWPQSTIINIC